MDRRFAFRAATLFCAWSCCPQVSLAQVAAPCAAALSIRDSAGSGVPGATVVIGESALRSDSLGDVRIATESETPVYARVRRIGFAPSRVMLYPSCGAPAMATTVTLDPIATRLSTVTVSAARRPVYTGRLAAFY